MSENNSDSCTKLSQASGQVIRPTGRLRMLQSPFSGRLQQEWHGNLGTGWVDVPVERVGVMPAHNPDYKSSITEESRVVKMLPEDERNPYLALAKIAWSNGDDGEVIARQLAEAFAEIARDGIGPDADIAAELVRLAPQAKVTAQAEGLDSKS